MIFKCPQIKWNDIYPRIPDYVTDFMLGNSLMQCNSVPPSNVCGNILDVLVLKKADVVKVCALLSDLPYFNTATDVTDIDAAWDTWLQHYNTSLSECVPQVSVRESNASLWFDS